MAPIRDVHDDGRAVAARLIVGLASGLWTAASVEMSRCFVLPSQRCEMMGPAGHSGQT
jgi:hypothetical protein